MSVAMLSSRQMIIVHFLLIILNFVILLVVIFAVGSLLTFQIQCLYRNVTTVEQKAYRWARLDAVDANRVSTVCIYCVASHTFQRSHSHGNTILDGEITFAQYLVRD